MPLTDTCTAFYTWTTTSGKIRSAEVNKNFEAFRGTIIPVHPSDSGPGTTGTYDIGSDTYKWKSGYFSATITALEFKGTNAYLSGTVTCEHIKATSAAFVNTATAGEFNATRVVAAQTMSCIELHVDTITGSYVPPAGVSVLQWHRVTTGNSWGSTNTKVRRFTTTVDSTGSSISFTDDASLGSFWTVNTAGVYAASYMDQCSTSTGSEIGISKNSSQLTTAPGNITAANRYAYAQIVNYACITALIPCVQGDIIRAHAHTNLTNADARTMFWVGKVENL